MCISEFAYLFRLYWFKHNEKFNGDSTNKVSIDLSPIEVMANPAVLLMLDQLSEIKIIREHKAWVCSLPLYSQCSHIFMSSLLQQIQRSFTTIIIKGLACYALINIRQTYASSWLPLKILLDFYWNYYFCDIDCDVMIARQIVTA